MTEHPPRADNVYDNPFWSQASMMLTDRNGMCRCNVFSRRMAGGERTLWFGDQATLYMPVGGVHGAVQRIRDKARRASVRAAEGVMATFGSRARTPWHCVSGRMRVG